MSEPMSFDEIRAKTLPQVLREQARRLGAETALRDKHLGIWREVSWAGYYQRARDFALVLHRAGLQRGDRIAIASEDTPEWFIADLGAQMLGVEVAGIYPTNPWNELQYIVRHCKAKVVVCGDQEQTDKVLDARDMEGGLPDLQLVICVDPKGMGDYFGDEVRDYEGLMEAAAATGKSDPGLYDWLEGEIDKTETDDVCTLVYTSGTTGPPKGAMLSHANITYATTAFATAVGLKGSRFEAVCYLPLCHVAERCYSMGQHLILGGVVNFAEAIETVSANIREIAPTYFLGVPRIWEKMREDLLFRAQEETNPWRRPFQLALSRIAKLEDRDDASARLESWFWDRMFFANVRRYLGLDQSKVRVSGGGSISPETLRFFKQIGIPVLQGFGLTESCGVSFIQRPDNSGRVGNCGLPVPGTEWKLAEDGEVLIKAPSVFRGYLYDDTATANTMDGDWLLTGDVGREDDNGELAIIDRKKAIIVTSGGKNIAPSEIENALKDSSFIREAIVVGEGRKFIGGLIQIDFDTVGRWASENDLTYTTYKSLAKHPAVYELISGVVDKVNARFARVENVRRFVILDKELDHDDGELTATQKIRRSLIETKFAKELDAIYGEAKAHAIRS